MLPRALGSSPVVAERSWAVCRSGRWPFEADDPVPFDGSYCDAGAACGFDGVHDAVVVDVVNEHDVSDTVERSVNGDVAGLELVTAEEVAELLGLSSHRAVSVYRGRYDDFPEPVICKGRCTLWLRSDVEAWRRRRTS